MRFAIKHSDCILFVHLEHCRVWHGELKAAWGAASFDAHGQIANGSIKNYTTIYHKA